ncbi:ribonuclease Z [Aequorivita sp. SDUM287046]|uniref:Ribonuclease Z n=1 Tax=Aequorivita aurantiaca TaxID=3053356 RepID=A0ABT8DG43_9FLAO|nr:ribonuclease Z [Aequorivita aurantiaca]MDN3723629.1 ribonuclease Z [Aequorivita aurantiaca]
MKLTILGCHSATPTASAHPTAQVLEMKGHLFLIDCGEGTQMQLRKCSVKFSRIRHIFISHLHGDHFYGLVGLISTFLLLGRKAELHVYGPKGIKEAILLLLKLGKAYTNYPLYFHELEASVPEVIFEDGKVSVETIPLDHRVYTNGFLFREKPDDRKLNVETARSLDIDLSYYNKIKKGFDVENRAGKLIPNHLITFDPPPPKSYAYCSDTAFHPEMVPQIENVTVLYHEATFLEAHQHLCEKTKHSTAKEAGTIAKMANVDTLILGHYSGRYGNLELFRKEAKEAFENVELAEDEKHFHF